MVESDSEGDDGAAEAAKAMDEDDFGEEPTGDMDVDEEETVAAPVKRKSRRAMIDSDDDEEDEEAPRPALEDSPATANGDTPMGNSANADSEDE